MKENNLKFKTLAIDIETYSDIDLSKVGVYAYCDNINFEILLFAYAFDEEEVKIIDLKMGEKLPKEVLEALQDENIIKTAFNAAFERVCISKYLNIKLLPKSWVCTAVQASQLALPSTLQKVGEILKIKDQKLKEGKELIKYFTMPCKPTKSNDYRTRNLPNHDWDRWKLFKKYCMVDVKAESQIRNKLKNYPINKNEQEIYEIDQEINDRGICIDNVLVGNAIKCNNLYKERLNKRTYELTGLNNTNSPAKLKQWLLTQGVSTKTLDKKTIINLLKDNEGDIEEVLKLRLMNSKTSIKKYEAIERSLCTDNRVRGLLQFNGASRTGRWSGRLIQVQNLPQNHMVDLDLARELLKMGKFEEIELFYNSTAKVLSELIRTSFIPREECEFIVADFSAIEARVLAWIANESWRLKVFQSHGKIYEASAATMFNLPIEEITKESHLRQKGKIAELALGYGGSIAALISMGALEMGIKEEELLPLVHSWRYNNSQITQFWWEVGRAALKTVKYRIPMKVGKISFHYDMRGILFITLPSNRKLSYIKPRIVLNNHGKEGLVYEGINSNKRWTTIETYGPKLVENIVQAISRDLLANVLRNLRNKDIDVVMHVHDEVVVEVEKGKYLVDDICNLMKIPPSWAEELPLDAHGYKCDFYKKD